MDEFKQIYLDTVFFIYVFLCLIVLLYVFVCDVQYILFKINFKNNILTLYFLHL